MHTCSRKGQSSIWTHPIHGDDRPLPVFALESLRVELSGGNTNKQNTSFHLNYCINIFHYIDTTNDAHMRVKKVTLVNPLRLSLVSRFKLNLFLTFQMMLCNKWHHQEGCVHFQCIWLSVSTLRLIGTDVGKYFDFKKWCHLLTNSLTIFSLTTPSTRLL